MKLYKMELPLPLLAQKLAFQNELIDNGNPMKGATMLVNIPASASKVAKYCMAGFILKNTLSDNGGVTRGVCQIDKNANLMNVVETHNISKTISAGEVGAVVPDDKGGLVPIDSESYVSMNMWGLAPDFLDVLEDGFAEFLSSLKPGDIKSEYLLPTIMDELIKSGRAEVKLLETHDKWFGVTYKEDKQTVVDAFKQLIFDRVYAERLFV